MKKILLIILLCPIMVNAYSTSATSTTLIDTASNRTIYANNENEIRSVASISKIMTAILAIESNKLDDDVIIKDYVSKAYGSGIYIKIGEKLKLIDLVYGLLLRSGNDAALAIANTVSNSEEEFVNLMNKKAKELNMKDTTFNNPSGLDGKVMKGNFSTSHDMAILMSYCMKNETFRKITKTSSYKLNTNMNNYYWVNKNKLLRNYKYANGGKTGFTEIAKRTLITSAKKGNTELVVVTLNDGNDFSDHKRLYEEAFKEYKTIKIIKKGYIQIPDEKFYKNVKFYVKEKFNYTINDRDEILIKYILDEKFKYKNNDVVGKLEVYNKKNKIFDTDIYIKIKKKKIDVIEYMLGLFK